MEIAVIQRPAGTSEGPTGSGRTEPERLKLRPEFELILCCASTSPGVEAGKRILELVRGPVDWKFLFGAARDHSVFPLVCHTLGTIGAECVPDEVRRALRPAIFRNAQQNLFLTREALSLLDMFASAGIQALPYKGPILSQRVYGDVALRQYSDLDILVRRKDVPRAMELLASRDYLCVTKEKNPDKDRRFVSSGSGILVELHWAITSKNFACSFDVRELWQDVQPVEVGGQRVMALSPEKLLLVLVLHGTKHAWERLLWICDVAELLRVHPEMEWDRVFRTAGKYGMARMVRVALALAQASVGAALSERAAREVERDPEAPALATLILNGLFHGGRQALWDGKGSLLMRVRERRLDRIRLGWRILASSLKPRRADLEVLRLPSWLAFLYYPIRMVRLPYRYGTAPLRRFLKELSAKAPPSKGAGASAVEPANPSPEPDRNNSETSRTNRG